MSHIEQYQLGDGTYCIRTKDLLIEADVEQIIDTLKSIYQNTQATYVILDLQENYVLPIRILATQIRLYYKELPTTNAPLFVAMLVEPSLVQMMGTILTTLMKRDAIQPFTEMKRAKQWLMLERMKQQKVKDIGAIMREKQNKN
jgi:hypothetical protein